MTVFFFIKRAHFFDLNSRIKSIFIPMKQKYKPWVQTSYGLTATANAKQDIIIISKHLTQALWGSHWHFVMLLCGQSSVSNFRENYLRENPELLKQLLIGHFQKKRKKKKAKLKCYIFFPEDILITSFIYDNYLQKFA